MGQKEGGTHEFSSSPSLRVDLALVGSVSREISLFTKTVKLSLAPPAPGCATLGSPLSGGRMFPHFTFVSVLLLISWAAPSRGPLGGDFCKSQHIGCHWRLPFPSYRRRLVMGLNFPRCRKTAIKAGVFTGETSHLAPSRWRVNGNNGTNVHYMTNRANLFTRNSCVLA